MEEGNTHAGASIGAGRRVLIVGAGGFVGPYLVEEGLRLGYEVWAGVRASTSRERLTDPRIRFIVFDYDEPSTLADAMTAALPDGRWDYVIYNLGATKVIRYSDFNRVNYEYLQAFTGALHRANKVPLRLVYISSISVLGARHERDGLPCSEEMVPQPNTRYGASKLKAELWLATAGIPYSIVRATGVYGPGDKDYALMVDAIRRGWDFGVGFRRQTLTFIYAADLARAAYLALVRGGDGEVYHITEPRAYTQKEFRRIVMRELGKKAVVPLRLPIWMVGAACGVMEKLGALRGKPSTLNSDKFRILRQRNWNCTWQKAQRELGFTAEVSLEEGIKKLIREGL